MLAPLLVALVAAQTPTEFYAHWSDSRAELDGYRLTQPRYGEPRPGEAIMVWVTEGFSAHKHVKLDHPEKAGEDSVTVMKLNLIRKFVTGIYDYSLMTSVFSPVVFPPAPSSAETPLKISFTSQEWCGNVFQQLVRNPDALESRWFSYFEAEGDGAERIALSDDLLTDDETWYRMRELTRPFKSGTYRLIPALHSVRLSHAPPVPGTVTVSRSAAPETLTVPAGTFVVTRWTLALSWGPRGNQRQARTVWVESALPHRIIAWEGDAASFQGNEPSRERAELTGSIRDTYWSHHRLGDEHLRSALGL